MQAARRIEDEITGRQLDRVLTESVGDHEFAGAEVHARLATSLKDADNQDNTGDSPAALAAVGKRTLFVEPVKMANDFKF